MPLPLASRRILILVENLPVPFDRRVWQEARALRDAGAEVTVICPTGKGWDAEHEVIEGISVYRHPLPIEGEGAVGYAREYAAALWHQTRLAWRVKRREGFDTIQACNPPDLLFLVALPFKWLFGTRFVFDHHDINPELFEAKFGRRGMLWRILVLMERLTFRAADVVISTNESYRALAHGRGGKDPEDVFVVRSAPDLSRVSAPAPDPNWRRGRQHAVGYVGIMGEQEGLDLLLHSMAKVIRSHDVQLVLMGDGPARPGLERLADTLGLSDHVTFTGLVNQEQLFAVLSSVDLGVGPDRVMPMNDKSTMNKILEYMAAGKPMVQFEVTEGRVSAGPASLYAAANDTEDFAAKIVELLDDPRRAAEMGRLGRQRLEEKFDWTVQVPNLIAAYRRAAAVKPQVRPARANALSRASASAKRP
ncbi:glycosyltransferase family 4 protein [Palleronia sp.]|uniref:glycosyltransferase family 4 protein n=1 Tax=Palleronia sp. TaxID=1940284 RepID=UPI0035C79CBB